MALQPQIRVVQATNMARQTRRMRRPKHTFNLKFKPYEIVPAFIAPVLPGETLDNLLLQIRAVTDPMLNSLIGGHMEMHVFYVKHRGLASTDTTGLLQSMMLDPTTDLSTLKAAANSVPYYTFKTGMDYVQMCHKSVITAFFRDEGEAWNAATIENYPAAQIEQEGWYHSLKEESATGDDSELPGVDELEELDILPGFSTHYTQWEIMRDNGMTDLTYNDYLKSYGVSVPKDQDDKDADGDGNIDKHEPELVRSFRKFSYPSNVINPADGTAKSALFWNEAFTADKKRFFKEPGFLYAVTIMRPKLYLGNQKGAAVGLLNDAYSWLPAVLNGMGYTSVKEVLDSLTDGILQNQDEDYWIDLADLYNYGDQFVNHAMGAAANHGLALPSANDAGRKYVTDAMMESLFVTAGTDYVKMDGAAHLNILTRVPRDETR